VATPAPRAFPIAAEVTIGPAEQTVLKFDAPAVPEGRIGVLVFKARLHSPRVGGHTPALRLLLNGAALAGDRLVNKPARAPARSGDVYSLYAGDVLRLFYAPDYTSADQDQHYGLLNGVPACDFQMDVTDRLKVGANELTVVYGSDKVSNPLHLAEVGLELRYPPPPEAAKRPAPTGPLEVYEPAADHAVTYQLETLADNRLKVTVNGQAFALVPVPHARARLATAAMRTRLSADDHRRTEESSSPRLPQQDGERPGHHAAARATAAQDPRAGTSTADPFAAGGKLTAIRPTRRPTSQPSPPCWSAADQRRDAAAHAELAGGPTMGWRPPTGAHGRRSTVVEWPSAHRSAELLAFPQRRGRLLDVNFPLDGAFCFFRAPTLTDDLVG